MFAQYNVLIQSPVVDRIAISDDSTVASVSHWVKLYLWFIFLCFPFELRFHLCFIFLCFPLLFEFPRKHWRLWQLCSLFVCCNDFYSSSAQCEPACKSSNFYDYKMYVAKKWTPKDRAYQVVKCKSYHLTRPSPSSSQVSSWRLMRQREAPAGETILGSAGETMLGPAGETAPWLTVA